MKLVLLLPLVLLLAGCGNDKTLSDGVQLGEAIFENNCSSCHGKKGQGLTKDWKQRQANGMFPAPPLNGTAHTWHHSPKALMNTINNGGIKLGGWMPAFKDQLSEAEKQAVIDYIYSLWPENVQQKFDARFK